MFPLCLPERSRLLFSGGGGGLYEWTWGERTPRTKIVRTFPAGSRRRGFNFTKAQLTKFGRTAQPPPSLEFLAFVDQEVTMIPHRTTLPHRCVVDSLLSHGIDSLKHSPLLSSAYSQPVRRGRLGKKRNVHLRSGRRTPKKIVSKTVTSCSTLTAGRASSSGASRLLADCCARLASNSRHQRRYPPSNGLCFPPFGPPGATAVWFRLDGV